MRFSFSARRNSPMESWGWRRLIGWWSHHRPIVNVNKLLWRYGRRQAADRHFRAVWTCPLTFCIQSQSRTGVLRDPHAPSLVRSAVFTYLPCVDGDEVSDVFWDRHLRTRPVWDQKNRFWSCMSNVVLWNTRVCFARCHNNLEEYSNFSSNILFTVSLFCAWNITTVEINSGFYLLKILNSSSAFVYFRWSWSCYFGLGHGLKNLVLFTSLDGVWNIFVALWEW